MNISFSLKALLIICIYFIVGCCTSSTSIISYTTEELFLSKVRKSVVVIDTITEVNFIDKKSSKLVLKKASLHSGSGTIVRQSSNSTIVMTAAHVCDIHSKEALLRLFPFYNENDYLTVTKNKYTITAVDGTQYAGILITMVIENDLCSLATSKIEAPQLQISNMPLSVPQKTYLIGYPGGIRHKNYSPIFSGYFIGEIQIPNKGIVFSYSMTAYPGTSGGPVFDANGNVLGIINAYLVSYPTISISSTTDQIRSMLELTLKTYEEVKEEINSILPTLQMEII